MSGPTNVKDLLTLHEGVRRFPYVDTVGKLTIGVGFNLTDVGLYPEEIDFILENRISKVECELEKYLPWFHELSDARQAVLVDMCYNLGPEPFNGNGVKDWPIFLSQLSAGEFALAAANMRKTKWAKQVGPRAERLAKMMETGEWP